MPYVKQIATEKANIINRDKRVYGTFAEIGAGQEVAQHFFKAGLSSQTVAKSMSAYDMTISDLIYGKSKRYVCEQRLIQMLDHEYQLIDSRLKKNRGPQSCFFSYANTVAVSTVHKDIIKNREGWMGLRFQPNPLSKSSQILLHLNLMDQTRLQQYELLGVLGVNLIYTAFYNRSSHTNMIKSLVDNFEKIRVQIDILKCEGSAFRGWDTDKVHLELIKQDLTPMVAFDPNPIALCDLIYAKSVLVYSEKQACKKSNEHLQFLNKKLKTKLTPLLILPKSLEKSVPKASHPVLIHNFKKWYELKDSIRKHTDKEIIFHVSMEELLKFFDDKVYSHSERTFLETIGHFFDKKTKLFIPQTKKKILNQTSNDLIRLCISRKNILCIDE